jgi:translocation and assembly module TamB
VRRPVKISLWLLGGLLSVLGLLGLAAVLILPSDWFREKVRARIVYEVERASGGRTEIGSFKFDWSTMTAEVSPFVLRGTEPDTAAPLFSADAVRVGLKIVSAFKRDIDIAALVVERPRINLLVDEGGVTNFPRPRVERKSDKDPIERLVDLAVQRITLRNGELTYADQRVPLHLDGERLEGSLAYNFSAPSYLGTLSLEKLTVDAGPLLPMEVAVESRVELFRNKLQLHSANMRMRDTQMQVAGTVEDFKKLRIHMAIQANGTLEELGKPLRLPQPHVGNVQFKGDLEYVSGGKIQIAGRVTGQGLAFRQAGVHIQNIAVASDVKLTSRDVVLTGLRVDALDGRFDGMFQIQGFRRYKANGKATGLSLIALSRLAGLKGRPFSGFVSGPVELTGSFDARDIKAAGRLDVTAATGGVPVHGFVEAAYDQRGQSLQLGNSHLNLPNTKVEFKGTLGRQLAVKLDSRDLNDIVPVVAALANAETEELPLTLRPSGAAQFQGLVSGSLRDPRITGDVTLTNFEVRDQPVDRLVATIDATKSGVKASSFAGGQDQLQVEGSADVALENWRVVDASAVSASLKVRGARVAKLLADAGRKLPVDGTLSATVQVQGTARDPKASAVIDVTRPEFYGETFDRFRASIRYAGAGVEVIDGVAEIGTASVVIAGAYEHPVGDWTNGRLSVNLSTRGFALQTLRNVQQLRPGVLGDFELKASAVAVVRHGEILPETIDGVLDLRRLTVQGREIGNFSVDAKTTGRNLTFGIAGNFRGSKITGGGTFNLSGDYPGSGQVDFTALTFSTVQDLLVLARRRDPLPFDGIVEGRVKFDGPAKKPEQMRAQIELSTLTVVAARSPVSTSPAQRLSVRNEGPVVIDYDGSALNVKSAHLVGPGTDLTVNGAVALRAKSVYDLRVNGTVNLELLQDFHAEIISSGNATVNATVRGPLHDPNVTGRTELKNASFYMTDFPNGLDNANGTIVFDKRRANIEKLTAETGGGSVAISGVVAFANPVNFQLQARADGVRIRYPEGVSTNVSATLALNGTHSRSLLSGLVTIRRAGFNPRTDIGGLIAQAKPASAPVTTNEFLRGMQFDVRIETVPNLQFQTSLTQDVQAEADLRLRGTAARPVLLGRILVSQGEIQFFGNRYTINRGEIGFFNPIRIEPVLDMDLETRVRGVLVNINFTGTLGRLNVSYRSDPPLQSTDIIALLAVGRAPGSNATLAATQPVTNQNVLSTGGNTLLGQALAAPISGRLQRFFGVSRLKIDPQLTGVNAIPQARLTIEQQISRDITLTYITNLAEANQQIIRLEWDINREWSIVALREENGLFGMDFFYKKRF